VICLALLYSIAHILSVRRQCCQLIPNIADPFGRLVLLDDCQRQATSHGSQLHKGLLITDTCSPASETVVFKHAREGSAAHHPTSSTSYFTYPTLRLLTVGYLHNLLRRLHFS
jgi:hypothetical protein